MKKISNWAYNNPITSRWMIAGIHITGGILAVILGILFFQLDWISPKWLMFLTANLFMLSYFLYPYRSHKKGLFKYSYVRQKVLDFSLGFLGFITIAFATNFYLHDVGDQARENIQAQFIVYHPNNQVDEFQSKKEIRQFFKAQRKKIRTEIRALRKAIKAKKGETTKAEKRMLTFLIILLGVVASFGLLALSCNIFCSGNEALSIVVLILGTFGIVWLAIVAIKGVWGLRKKKSEVKKTRKN